MKRLLLVRHAKAVHDNDYTDFERPLKHKGVQNATDMAERLKSESLIPQVLITSPSLRTQATADIFAEHLGLSKPKQNKNIYDAGRHELLKIISEFDDKHDFVGFVGHNPGIAELIYYYSGKTPDVSPGSVALVAFEVDEWKLLGQDTGTMTWFSSPKEH